MVASKGGNVNGWRSAMQLDISGKKINIGQSLQDYVRHRLVDVVDRYFRMAVHGTVVFSRERRLFRADIHIVDGIGRRGLISKSFEISDDIYSAFDAALAKLERQLRRYHDKLVDHHPRRDGHGMRAMEWSGRKYIMERVEHARLADDATEFVGAAEWEPVDPQAGHAAIIAEKTAVIRCLSVADAVMHMDLEGLPALLFLHDKTGRLNVVYQRADGHIAWVDPGEEIPKAESEARMHREVAVTA
jgi:ribosomal subunit interface protein